MKEKTQNKEQNKAVKVLKAILNTIINILIVVVLITSLLIAVMALTSKSSGISTIFGMTIQTIQSDSMKGGSPDGYGGGDFSSGDLVIGRATDFDEFAEYEVGDIVTMVQEDADGNDYLLAHRIVDKVEGEDGYPRYQTWGDNREVSQMPDQMTEDYFVAAYDIGSLLYSKDYNATVLRGVGSAIDFIRQPQGFFFVVLLPMIIFFLYALFRVVLSATSYKKAVAQEDVENAEREKQEAVEAAVAAALAAKDAESNPAQAPAPDALTAEQMEQFKQFMAFQQMQNAAKDAAPEPAEAPVEAPTQDADAEE